MRSRAAVALCTAIAVAGLPCVAAAAPDAAPSEPAAPPPIADPDAVPPEAPLPEEPVPEEPTTEQPSDDVDAPPPATQDAGTTKKPEPAAEPERKPAPIEDAEGNVAPPPATEAEEAAEEEEAEDELPPLTKLQTAGWWTLFGAFAVGTTAGVLAGLAERQEDRALRLATLFDGETMAQPEYEDEQAEYERYLRRGKAYQRGAIGLAAVSGAVVIAGIVLFAIDASRRKAAGKSAQRARVQVRPTVGGWEVAF